VFEHGIDENALLIDIIPEPPSSVTNDLFVFGKQGQKHLAQEQQVKVKAYSVSRDNEHFIIELCDIYF
jgi:hypothetical protein